MTAKPSDSRQTALLQLFDELQALGGETRPLEGDGAKQRAASRIASVGLQLAAWAEQDKAPSSLSFGLLGATRDLEAKLDLERSKTREVRARVASCRGRLKKRQQRLAEQQREIGALSAKLDALDARLLRETDDEGTNTSLDELALREVALLLELSEQRQAEQRARAQQEARLLAELGVSLGSTVAAAKLLEQRDEHLRVLGQLQRITPKLSLTNIEELVKTLRDARGRLADEVSALQEEPPRELAAEVLGLEAAARWRAGAARGAEVLAAHLEAAVDAPREPDRGPARRGLRDDELSPAASAAEQLWKKGELEGKKRWLAAMGPLLKTIESAVTNLRGRLDGDPPAS